MKKVFVVFLCDIWKSSNSMQFEGVFTNRSKLNKTIKELVSEGSIEVREGFKIDYIKYSSIEELNNNIHHIFIDDVVVNERQ